MNKLILFNYFSKIKDFFQCQKMITYIAIEFNWRHGHNEKDLSFKILFFSTLIKKNLPFKFSIKILFPFRCLYDLERLNDNSSIII